MEFFVFYTKIILKENCISFSAENLCKSKPNSKYYQSRKKCYNNETENMQGSKYENIFFCLRFGNLRNTIDLKYRYGNPKNIGKSLEYYRVLKFF